MKSTTALHQSHEITVPFLQAVLSPMMNGRMSSGDDPFSDLSAASPDTRDPNTFFNNDDAFASFSANDTVSKTMMLPVLSFILVFLLNRFIYF